MQSREGSERTTVTLPLPLAQRLRVDAEAGERSVSSIVREALEAYYETKQAPEMPSFTAIGRSGKSDIGERAEAIIGEMFDRGAHPS
jgi:Arc/MetJ-type ribon-helix-helix transcriptional regulator